MLDPNWGERQPQGKDPRSTNADNTSAFNCRLVEGTHDWSMHAYGLAVDINPCENVYIDGARLIRRGARRTPTARGRCRA